MEVGTGPPFSQSWPPSEAKGKIVLDGPLSLVVVAAQCVALAVAIGVACSTVKARPSLTYEVGYVRVVPPWSIVSDFESQARPWTLTHDFVDAVSAVLSRTLGFGIFFCF